MKITGKFSGGFPFSARFSWDFCDPQICAFRSRTSAVTHTIFIFMWMVLGISAIVFTILNLVWTFNNKNAKWLRFAGLALTALTLCAFYADGAGRVVAEDWGGLMDIMPTMNKALWGCTVISILLNSVSLLQTHIP